MVADILHHIALVLFILIVDLKMMCYYHQIYYYSEYDLKKLSKTAYKDFNYLGLVIIIISGILYAFYLLFPNVITFILTIVMLILILWTVGLHRFRVNFSLKFKYADKFLIVDLVVYVILLFVFILLFKFAGMYYFALGHLLFSQVLFIAKTPIYQFIRKRIFKESKKEYSFDNLDLLIMGTYGKSTIKNFIRQLYSKSVFSNRDQSFINEEFYEDLENKEDKKLALIEYPYLKEISKICAKQYLICDLEINEYKSKERENVVNLLVNSKDSIIFINNNSFDLKQLNLKNVITYAVEEKANYVLKRINQKEESMQIEISFNNEIIVSDEVGIIDEINLQNLVGAVAFLHHNKLDFNINNVTPLTNRMTINFTETRHVLNDSSIGGLRALTSHQELISTLRGKKTIITAGLTGYGKIQKNVQFEYGKSIARYYHHFFIIRGDDYKNIVKGIQSINSNAYIYTFRSLEDASKEFFDNSYYNEGIVLIDNDKSIIS